jgi:hypothetical protein
MFLRGMAHHLQACEAVSVTDGIVVRRDPWGEFHDSPRWHPLDGIDHQAHDFGLDADEVQLPASLLFSPDWNTP